MNEKGEAPTPPAPEARVVTDLEIASALESILRNANAFTSLNGVIQQLQAKLGVDLGHRLDFIRSQIHHHLLLQSQAHHNFVPPQQQQQHFASYQTHNFYAAPSQHFPSSFISHRPPPQLQSSQLSPPLPMAVKESKVTTAGVSAKEASKGSAPLVKKRRGGPGGLNKVCGVSPELQTIVGQPTLPRTEIVKQLWAYIRKHNLQDPNNKRKIICNDELRLVFETDCTDMFKMNKLLAKHIFPLEPTKQPGQNIKKQKVDVESRSKIDDPVPIVIISEPLASFFGSDEREMSQAEVLRQMWEYIKDNQLEDPSNPVAIRCDAKLQEILGCESISALGIPEMLARLHLIKKS